ncbi:MAG: hypothetical protein ABI415_03145 [Flavitalea sp.]
MILIFGAWIFYFLLCLAIGAGTLKIISRFIANSIDLQYDIIYQFWFGFAILIGVLQMTSLFFPIGNTAFIIISLLAFIYPLTKFKTIFNQLSLLWGRIHKGKGLFSIVIICIILLLASYCANKEVTHTDTFLYHFNAVKWARQYPVVPGLANLHNRLGFNSSFFLFAAFTEVGMYADHSAQIALSFLMTVCFIQWFIIISGKHQSLSTRIFCLVTMLFLIMHITFKMDFASLSTDYPVAVLTLVFSLILLDKINHKILLLLPIAAVVFTFKLSGLLTIATGLIFMTGAAFMLKYSNKENHNRKTEVKLIAVSFSMLCFIVSGFIIRNIIVSGWLIYPFPIGNLHLPWSVPKPYVLDMIDWIHSFPKIPGGASPATIHGHNVIYWFSQWFDHFKQSPEFAMLIISAGILLWFVYHATSVRKFFYGRLNVLLLCIFSLASILFWFISAPDVRFGSVYFFIFFASSVVILIETTKHKTFLKILIFTAFTYQLTYVLSGIFIDRAFYLFTFAYTKNPKLVHVIASPKGQTPPLYIYMPAEGNQCGNSPLPCSPYAGGLLDNHQLIRQRVPGDLSKGFLHVE